MPFLGNFALDQREGKVSLFSPNEAAAVYYHNLFDFPLKIGEAIKWAVGKKGLASFQNFSKIKEKNGYFFISGREGLIYQRILRERISVRKLRLAQRAARILGFLPTVKLVAVTGALAMGNAGEESDVDLLVVTKANALWRTRLVAYGILKTAGYKIRVPKKREQKDRLCLNIWLDETALVWPTRDHNLYTAHEITQMVPLVNKEKTYERFLHVNSWLLAYWPNAVKICRARDKKRLNVKKTSPPISLWERLAYRLQRVYMKSKLTREVVTPHKALFHPVDWSRQINEILYA